MRKLLLGAAGAALAFTLASGALAGEERALAPPQAAGDDAAARDDRLADFFQRTKGITRLVPASEVWESVHSGSKKYFVVDVRPAEDFAKGHVPGAISLPIDVLFRPASLAKLPARGQAILLVCQSGHTESMALGGLAALGYEPWAMRFGMIGWNAETNVKAGSPMQDGDAVHGVGGPIER
jgi:sulfur-carrier protein adenylyltransferase/sulfurtransferase